MKIFKSEHWVAGMSSICLCTELTWQCFGAPEAAGLWVMWWPGAEAKQLNSNTHRRGDHMRKTYPHAHTLKHLCMLLLCVPFLRLNSGRCGWTGEWTGMMWRIEEGTFHFLLLLLLTSLHCVSASMCHVKPIYFHSKSLAGVVRICEKMKHCFNSDREESSWQKHKFFKKNIFFMTSKSWNKISQRVGLPGITGCGVIQALLVFSGNHLQRRKWRQGMDSCCKCGQSGLAGTLWDLSIR